MDKRSLPFLRTSSLYTLYTLGTGIMMALAVLFPPPAAAQDLLPQGVGLYQYGYRALAEQKQRYDRRGEKVSLADRFDRDLGGPALLSGNGGPDLQRLAGVLREFDGLNGGRLAEELTLGRVQGDVTANIKAQIFGLAFGITEKLTFFAGVPYINAKVETDVYISGDNNALQIRDQIGALGFEELRAGLERASQVSSQQIKESLLLAGYEPFDTWSHAGVGDTRVGLMTGWKRRLGRLSGFALGLTTQLEVPTGYTEDPDLLTDINFGRGYYSLGVKIDPRIRFARYILIGGRFGYAENFSANVEKRVPEGDERVVDPERRSEVEIRPGDDIEYSGFVGLDNWIFGSKYRAGVSHHFRDEYRGSLAGNYQRLGDESDVYQLYHELVFSVNTARLYKRQQFPVPFILSFTAHRAIEARNSPDDRYYEVSIASFFSTPLAKDIDAKKSREKRRSRTAH